MRRLATGQQWGVVVTQHNYPSLGGEKPALPRNLTGILTLSNSHFVHTSIFAIFLFRLCVMATFKTFKPLPT
jgi:hypothetical protein